MKTALVTGATSGIGRCIALELAARGYELRVVARSAGRLEELADEARRAGSPKVEVFSADLSSEAGLRHVARLLDDVDLLVNAAGCGTSHSFPHETLEAELKMLDLNVRAVLVLSHAAARAMSPRGEGAILNIGSTAAIWSTGTYAAGKAWIHTATDGLRLACADDGVSVTLVVPGFTRTEFHDRSATDATAVASWLWLDPKRVAREAVDAVLTGQELCIPGRRYRVLVGIVRHLRPTSRKRVLARLARLKPTSN